MHYENVAIPLGQAWSSPFVRWQGSLADVSSLDLAVAVTRRALLDRAVEAAEFEGLVLGWTVPQSGIFFGAPTIAARIGAERITGPMVNQACATSVACLHAAAAAVGAGGGTQLVVTTDRMSNGPQMIYPSPSAQGGAPLSEHWITSSFARDPWAENSMLAAGEIVAAELDATRAQLDDVAVLRSEQYAASLAENRAFQRRYMVPVELPQRRGSPLVVQEDGGVRLVDERSASALAPASPGGVHTFATQTHPADGCAGAVVSTLARARELSDGQGVVKLLSSGFARVARSHMPQASVPAAQAALDAAGLTLGDVNAITTHNPFAVNDLYFAAELGVKLEAMNNFGCSLIFGHPQGPTGMRSIAELIEQLRLRGGGIGLFTGCAAGDTGAALVIEVVD